MSQSSSQLPLTRLNQNVSIVDESRTGQREDEYLQVKPSSTQSKRSMLPSVRKLDSEASSRKARPEKRMDRSFGAIPRPATLRDIPTTTKSSASSKMFSRQRSSVGDSPSQKSYKSMQAPYSDSERSRKSNRSCKSRASSAFSRRVSSAKAVADFQKNNPATSNAHGSLKDMLCKNLMSHVVKQVRKKLIARDFSGFFYYIGTFELERARAKELPEEYENYLAEIREASRKHQGVGLERG